VTVTYTSMPHRHGGFIGELTLDNQGTSAVSGWQLAITLPGDDVDWVWNADWQFSDDSLILSPESGDQVIEPGDSITVSFAAHGPTTAPSSCTFNGAACNQQ
jgi:cellulase/cellobiase CelA1